MRKIRAYNRGDFRNTAVLPVTEIRTFFGFFENGLPVVGVLHRLKHPAALPCHEAVEPLVVGACRMRIPGLNAYKLAFGQANVIRTQSESVSLRFEEKFTLDEVRDFAALWGEETTTISGIDTTLIRFAADTQLAFPAEWVYGTPPSELKEDTCAVSTGFALECFGGQDVVGLKLCENTICGVFRHEEAVVLKPAREGFTAAELFPVPKKADLYRWGLDCAARAGLPEPSEVLCGTEGAFLAQLLPWTILVWLLLRLTGRKRWLIAALLLLLLLPDWFIPTRLSDTVFRMELGDSILGRFRDGLSLSPALRDQAWKEAWLRFCAAMLCCCILSNRQTKLSVIIRIAGCKNGLPLLSEVHFMISSVPKGCRFQKTIR